LNCPDLAGVITAYETGLMSPRSKERVSTLWR
jgi:hypothetical protein